MPEIRLEILSYYVSVSTNTCWYVDQTCLHQINQKSLIKNTNVAGTFSVFRYTYLSLSERITDMDLRKCMN